MRLLAIFAAAGTAAATSNLLPANVFPVQNVVAFGDSLTDAGRLSAYVDNNGSAPPPATDTSTSNRTAGGGYTWGHFATKQLDAKFYDYAVSGAFCSNTIFERYLASINRSFPSVLEDEIPSFQEDLAYVNASTGTNTFYPNRTPDNTVYVLWIGTNDLGGDAFLTDSQHKGLTITNFVDCVWDVFDAIYKTGGRRFVLFNQMPLDRSPLYAAPQNGGAGDSQYWPTKTRHCNSTQVEQRILEYSTNVNTMLGYGVPFQKRVLERWPLSSFAVFNVHQLLLDIRNQPEQYLDAPADAAGFYQRCAPNNGSDCTRSQNPLSSFMWFDELHPSEKTDEIIAKEFVSVVGGNSKYATYW